MEIAFEYEHAYEFYLRSMSGLNLFEVSNLAGTEKSWPRKVHETMVERHMKETHLTFSETANEEFLNLPSKQCNLLDF